MLFSRIVTTMLATAAVASAFQPALPTTSTIATSSSQLQAVMPPMIISSAIKKYKKEQAEKRMPMATQEEAKEQAPGLRVGAKVWKWPPVWPYDSLIFSPPEDIPQAKPPSMVEMAGMMSGIQQVPTTNAEEEEEEQVDKLDPAVYWGVENANVATEMDEEAVEKLKFHYAYYLKEGMDILELGAAKDSYFPESVKPNRHVGVGLQGDLMNKNPSLTDKFLVNLNEVVPDRDVDNDDLRKLAEQPFDAVIMANTVEYLTNPREVLRSAWHLLKPGGTMFIIFSGKEAKAGSNAFSRASTKIWRDYNDDQHMWICGSLFQFSAGDGWENMLGFDISPASAREMDSGNALDKVMNRGKSNNLYVVQATKARQEDTLTFDNLERGLRSNLWMMPVLEPRDKDLVIPRLVRAVQMATDKETLMQAIQKNLGTLPTLFEALVKMDQFAFTFDMQAQLAADLITNSDWDGNEEQMIALKQGLGLRKPTPEFWAPVGQFTSSMDVKDKVNLLGYLVPCFGTNNPAQENGLEEFITGLEPTLQFVRSRLPSLTEADHQLLATEFLAAEMLKPSSSTTRRQFSQWLAAMTDEEIEAPLKARRQLRQKCDEEYKAFKKEKADKAAEIEEQRAKYKEACEKARETRTMVINVRTGKFEEFKP